MPTVHSYYAADTLREQAAVAGVGEREESATIPVPLLIACARP